MVETIRAVREAAGPEFTIMVDVGYAWDDADRALAVIETWAVLRRVLRRDAALDGRPRGLPPARRALADPDRGGEWQATRFEFLDLMDRGGIHVVQPDVGRVGGLTEARRVCELAAERDLLVVPHGWKTGITIAATAQLAAITPHMPFFEFVPQEVAESPLRRELTRDELTLARRRHAAAPAPARARRGARPRRAGALRRGRPSPRRPRR